MEMQVRRTVLHVESVLIDGGRSVERPSKLIAAVAVLQNPWAGRGFVDDLSPEISTIAPALGKLLAGMIVAAAGGGDAVEGFGKCSVVGTAGELEHAAALIHTVPFGNQYRRAVEAKTYLSFNNTRGGPNAPIMIPLMDKHDPGRRSHYQSIQLSIADAPGPDELIVALGASTGPRPHHRIGSRSADLQALAIDEHDPAGIEGRRRP